MRDLVHYLVKALVDQPDKVVLEEKGSGDTVLFELSVAPEDMGKIIGKNGKTIEALRTVVQLAATSAGKKCRLEVLG
ncbi:KH domain-containing protein [Desulfosoma sp.]|uniref:RNA-binding protein KhpA n=1 Tax=Desulfacinum infernum TaxID=35837 RepID=A0A831ZXS6_9BACT